MLINHKRFWGDLPRGFVPLISVVPFIAQKVCVPYIIMVFKTHGFNAIISFKKYAPCQNVRNYEGLVWQPEF